MLMVHCWVEVRLLNIRVKGELLLSEAFLVVIGGSAKCGAFSFA